jgi:hypothetical protein
MSICHVARNRAHCQHSAPCNDHGRHCRTHISLQHPSSVLNHAVGSFATTANTRLHTVDWMRHPIRGHRSEQSSLAPPHKSFGDWRHMANQQVGYREKEWAPHTALRCAAQHYTAQHCNSYAQHTTAQHSAAPALHSTALHPPASFCYSARIHVLTHPQVL